METQPDIQQELLKQQQQLQQLMQQEQPKEEQKEEQKEERKILKMPLKGKKKITSMTDQLEHDMTIKILKQIQSQFQNSDDMRRLIDLHNEKGKRAFEDLFYAELKGSNVRSKPTIASAINNEIANMDITSLFSDVEKSIRSDLDSLIDTEDDKKEDRVSSMSYKQSLKCQLCGKSILGKQRLQSHYLTNCKKKSLMKSMETKDFKSDPNKLSDDDIIPIVIMILEKKDDEVLNDLEKTLIKLLEDQFVNHHIAKNSNIYIVNKNYEAKYHIVKDGKWRCEGDYNLFRERVVELFNNLSKYVEDFILKLSIDENKKATKIWEKIKLLMNTKDVVVHVTKVIFNYTYDKKSDLSLIYESSFQHINKPKKATK